ncbi:MAG: DUF2520 domain-containing protein [Chitinophagales bacterium]|nr:DUF2520 domain-containing protein [Chitinophagales bacterium]
MKISIVGAGNVATNLALALKKAGHEIVQIYNRSDDAGQELAHTVGAQFTSQGSQLLDADVYLLAVKDDVIAEVAKLIHLKGRIVAHTSGTKSMNELAPASEQFGIFYPLQTMKKNTKVDFKNVPLLVEGSSESVTTVLESLAKTISQNVYRVDEEQRQWIHLAAVFANNFTNHLFGISESIMQGHGLPFEILKPLIYRSIEGLAFASPAELQTGPAIRGDQQTIEKHMLLLGDDTRLQKMYEILTQSIIASVSQNHK